MTGADATNFRPATGREPRTRRNHTMIDTQMHKMLDDTKCAYAIGWSNLAAIADRVERARHQGDPISLAIAIPDPRPAARTLRHSSTSSATCRRPNPRRGIPAAAPTCATATAVRSSSATRPADGDTSYPKQATYCGDLGRGDDFPQAPW